MNKAGAANVNFNKFGCELAWRLSTVLAEWAELSEPLPDLAIEAQVRKAVHTARLPPDVIKQNMSACESHDQ